jgi:hypothetical protein
MLVSAIREASASGFYSARWGAATDLNSIPTVSREDLRTTPLSKRRYKREKGLVKVIHDERGAFLSEWSFADIGREEYGVYAKRPLVYLLDPHEAIEKSMWCYERGMLPLVGEKDAAITSYAAGRYQIDSLITDAESLAKLTSYLEGRTEPLDSISLIGASFDPHSLMPYRAYAARIRLVLSLPETGAFAAAELAAKPVFEALPGCTIEKEQTLIVSKDRMLVTPIIRYRTDIPTHVYDGA